MKNAQTVYPLRSKHHVMKNMSRCTGGGVWASQQMITEQQSTEGEKTGAGDEQQDRRLGGFPGHNQGVLVPGTEGKEEEIQTHSPEERVNEDTNTTAKEEREEGEGEREEGDGENGVWRERAEGESAAKIDISETNLSNIVSTPGCSSPAAEPGPPTRPPGNGEAEVQPTNSLLTLTEDGSFLGSGSPLTVDRVAAIQHLHRLALQYDIDRMSTSGSDSSTNIRLSLASSKRVVSRAIRIFLLCRTPAR